MLKIRSPYNGWGGIRGVGGVGPGSGGSVDSEPEDDVCCPCIAIIIALVVGIVL